MNMKVTKKLLVIGHRGANSIAPENSLKAFQKAIELGADYIEFDVQESKDEEIVVIHDENTLRTTGHDGEIKEMNLREIKSLDCGEGEKIPTLQELIDLTKNKINYNCEIKVKGIAPKVVNIFKSANLNKNTIFSSFIHRELLEIKDLKVKFQLAALEPTSIGNLKDWNYKKSMIMNASSHEFYAINPLYKLVDQKFVKMAHDHNLKVFPYTVDSKIAIKKMIKFGVDGIITNDIQKVKELIES
ncbi:MAG: hypothetical protein GF353_01810 [Candidatus Lokiarchaeota archaeon]|nr:hypothetical protein [Candidatus Lokiarchaeota archaeon]